MGPVEAAVDEDLMSMPDAPLTSGLRQSALSLARALDDTHNSATSRSMVARELRETLDRLRELAPPALEKDGIDAIIDQRDRRRAAAANPVDS